MMKSGCARSVRWPLDRSGGSAPRANEVGWIRRTDRTGQFTGASIVHRGKLMSSCGALAVPFSETLIRVRRTRS